MVLDLEILSYLLEKILRHDLREEALEVEVVVLAVEEVERVHESLSRLPLSVCVYFAQRNP